MGNETKQADLIEWIVTNVDERVVPSDEGNDDALIFNLVQLAKYGEDFKFYNYSPEQDAELKLLYQQYGRAA